MEINIEGEDHEEAGTNDDKPQKDNIDIFNELMKKQRKDVPTDKKLHYNDIKRICKYINNSIFDDDICCLWCGYVTNVNSGNKGTYINFYFGGKKVALHRLLYINFVGPLSPDEYLKFNCDNKGICCNVNHLKKFKYQKKPDGEENSENAIHTEGDEDTGVIILKKKVVKEKPKIKSDKEDNKVKVVNKNCDNNAKKNLFVDFDD